EIAEMSIAAIRKLNSAGIKCTVLTKGVLPNSLAALSPENEYGITLVSLDEGFRKEIEPFSAPYGERIDALRSLHALGCRTWVSVEPYPTPNIIQQDLGKILEAVKFTGRIIFGRTNYSKRVSSYVGHKKFYADAAREVINFCNERGITYHIKKGTAK
ncbi:MAG: hypothetical protein II877_11915, partial [Synergistaceae bacterium]|nr:hypothetical protein [Synergistaceae bacterium]